LYSGSDDPGLVAWYDENSYKSSCVIEVGLGPAHVGQKLPNEIGLYDMSGNVSEWCWRDDVHFPYLRGGNWRETHYFSLITHYSSGYSAYNYHGFRVVRSLLQ